MRKIDEIISKIIREEIEKQIVYKDDTFCLNEGIDIKYQNGKGLISYNPSHQNLINTSVSENPTVDNIDGVEVWSIFQRNNLGSSKIEIYNDGNPLIHALKNNEDNWFFESNRDKNLILNCANRILQKFYSLHNSDVTVMIPSTSFINKLLGNMYKNVDPNANIIKGLLIKMTTQEVKKELMKPTSLFISNYSNQLDNALELLDEDMELMNIKNNGIFSYHLVSNQEMRNCIEVTLKLCTNPLGKYGDLINNKNILLIDDSISRGSTIKQSINLIRSCFTPNSITALTMFSKKK